MFSFIKLLKNEFYIIKKRTCNSVMKDRNTGRNIKEIKGTFSFI